MYYLAGQIDVLDKTIKGLTLQQDASIEYTYHSHKKGDGSDSSVMLYQTTDPGGCYRAYGHTHNKTGTCPSGYATHAHSSACGRRNPMEVISRGSMVHCKCTICGRDAYKPDVGETVGWAIYECSNDACNYTSCNGALNSGFAYKCGSPTNTWAIGCGKTPAYIDEAHIVFK